MRRFTLLGAALSVLVLLITPGPAIGATPKTYLLPSETHAFSMTAGPENALWFVGGRGALGLGNAESVVGRVSNDGQTKLFGLPEYLRAWDIAAGSDGNLWFTETFINRRGYTVVRIGRMTPSGEFTDFRIGERVGDPAPITAGPDGNLWIADSYLVKGRRKKAIVRITPAGEVKRFQLSPAVGVNDITAGPDGNLWFTETALRGGWIGRITPQGRVSHFRLPRTPRRPESITVGPDGALWFSEKSIHYKDQARVGRITTAGEITEYPVPGSAWTYEIAAGASGDIWFTSELDRAMGLGSISPGGLASPLVCLQVEPCMVDADHLAIGPDGDLWVAGSGSYSYSGGGGSGISESIKEEQEAGLLVRYSTFRAG